MKKILSLFLAVIMALSIFAGLGLTAEASYGRVPYVYATVTEPKAGAKPVFEATVSSQYTGQVYNSYRNDGSTMINGVEWYDVTAQKSLGSNDVFAAGHEYTVGVLITCGSDYRFKHDNQPDTITFNSKYDGIGYYYPVGDYMDNELYYYIQYTFETLPINGWVKDGGNWYFYKNNTLQKGWISSGGKWYYMDKTTGAMKTGWIKDGGKWYFLDKKNGDMKTGWVKDGSSWYFMDKSGAMKTGWVKDGGKWYYMQSSGAMKTGWLKDGGKWYYLESSGAMLANTSKKISGKTYKFNSSGVCTNP